MTRIFNYKCTKHFLKRMKERRIGEYLISLCLARGIVRKEALQKLTYQLTIEQIKEAVESGYIDVTEYIGLYTLTVIVKENLLITIYARYSDVGL